MHIVPIVKNIRSRFLSGVYTALLLQIVSPFPPTTHEGQRSPSFNPIDSADEIVLAQVVGYDGKNPAEWTIMLDVTEILKGFLSTGKLGAAWVPRIPPGCDTTDCLRRAYETPPPRPNVGGRVITMLFRRRPGGGMIAYQEFTYLDSKEKREEIVRRLHSR